jgi:hypothetical protein|tara:strand:+ start:23 stop:130 length:108 start_codon:yes stop_codon:yes gene_type:complete
MGTIALGFFAIWTLIFVFDEIKRMEEEKERNSPEE